MPRDAVSRTANVGTVGTNGTRLCLLPFPWYIYIGGYICIFIHIGGQGTQLISLKILRAERFDIHSCAVLL